MSDRGYDLFVIGAGSGGVRAARVAAGLGARVAIAEERKLGGTCVNVGCVPKKLFVYAAQFREEFAAAKGFGWECGTPAFDWPTLLANKNREIERLNGVYRRLLETAGVVLYPARAAVADAHTVMVGGERISARHILIATGGGAVVPDFPGRRLVITSDEAFFLNAFPERIIIVGGGYIAVEFAGIFHGLGADTTLIYRGPLFLRGFDDELRAFLAHRMRNRGIALRFNADIHRVERADSGFKATLSTGDLLEADLIFYATGRAPNTRGMGLEELGVEFSERGAIKVDANYRSTVPSIYAVGDVTDRFNLTPVAIAEGNALAHALFGDAKVRVDYDYIPTTVFSLPNLGTVGLDERRARELHGDIAVFKSEFAPLKESLAASGETTFMKLLVKRKSDRVLGVHMVGSDAGEIMQGMAIALRAGVTKAVVDSTLGIHPTAAEEFVTMRRPAG